MKKTYLVVYTLHSKTHPNTYVDKYMTFSKDDFPDPLKEAKKFYAELLDVGQDEDYPDHYVYSISVTEVIESSDY